MIAVSFSIFPESGKSYTYIIKRNDRFSKVAGRFVAGPVWGKNGSFKKIMDLNPRFQNNPDLIFPGDKIEIEDYLLDPREKQALNLSSSQNRTPSSEDNQNWNEGSQKYRSFFLAEITDSLTKQDLKTSAGGYSELLSTSSPGFRLQWREGLSKTWDLDMSYTQYSRNQDAPIGTTLSGTSKYTSLNLGGLWNLNPGKENNFWRVGPQVRFGTEPISASLTNTSIRQESPQVLKVGGVVENESQISFKELKLRSSVSLWYAPTSNQSDYSITNGYGGNADLRLLHSLNRHVDLTGSVGYGMSVYKSSLGDHANQEINIGLGLSYRFHSNEEPAK